MNLGLKIGCLMRV
jgi:hypothetical protein